MVKKQRNKYIIPSIVVGLALIVSVSVISAVSAGVSLRQMIANVAGDKIAEGILGSEPVEDISLGAFPGPDVYNRMYFDGGFYADDTLQTVLHWSTSSPDGVQILLASVRAERDLFCDPHSVLLDVSTAVVSFGGSYRVGTTTLAGDESLTATTTATLMGLTSIASSTASIINVENATVSGTYFSESSYVTSTPFVLAKGEFLVATMDGAAGATSTASFNAAGGFTGVGRLHATCWNRY